MKNEKGELKMIELKDILYVPENSRKLLSVSKMKKAGAEVVFGASSFVRQGNASVYPLREESGLFLRDSFVGKDECYVVSTLKQWNCRMVHNNYKDLSHLEQHVEVMKISDFKIENCKTCELNSTLKQWLCRMGHNNYKDLTHLEQHVEGLKISDFKIENC